MKKIQRFIALATFALLLNQGAWGQEEKSSKSYPNPDGVYPTYGQYKNFKLPKALNLQEVAQKIGYPLAARAKGIEGEAQLMVLVDEKGRYRKHVYLNIPHTFLKEAIDKDIKHLRFSPATSEGKVIKFWVKVPLKFKLNN